MKKIVSLLCVMVLFQCIIYQPFHNSVMADSIWIIIEDFDDDTDKTPDDYTVYDGHTFENNGMYGNALKFTLNQTHIAPGIWLSNAQQYIPDVSWKSAWYKFNLKGPAVLDSSVSATDTFTVEFYFNDASKQFRMAYEAEAEEYGIAAGYYYYRANDEVDWTMGTGAHATLPNDFNGEIMFPLLNFCIASNALATADINIASGYFSERFQYANMSAGESVAVDNISITDENVIPITKANKEETWVIAEDFDGDGDKAAVDYTVWGSASEFYNNGDDGNAFSKTLTSNSAQPGIKIPNIQQYIPDVSWKDAWYKFDLIGPAALDSSISDIGTFTVQFFFNDASVQYRMASETEAKSLGTIAGYYYYRENGEGEWNKANGYYATLFNDFNGEIMFPLSNFCINNSTGALVTADMDITSGWFSERFQYANMSSGEKYAIDDISISGSDMTPDNVTDIIGDANGDDLFDVRDLVRLKKYLANIIGSIAFNEADVDDNNIIDTVDIVTMRKKLLDNQMEKKLDIALSVYGMPKLTEEFNPPFSSYTWTETSPYVFEINGKQKALISNSRSVIYDLAEGMSVFDDGAYIKESAKFAAWPLTLDLENNASFSPENVPDGGFWRRNYYNVFGAYQYSDNVFSVLHGENKNVSGSKGYYNNTIKPDDTVYAEDEYTSDANGENWDNYFAFVTMSRSSVNTVEATGNLIEEDYGPVVWSVRPLLDSDNNKVSQGLRHPSYLIDNGYIYIYYIDNPGAYQEVVHCARAKIDEKGKPGKFYKLYNGEFCELALPEDFDANDRSCFYQAGGKADNILSTTRAIRFYPAKLKGTEYYIGLLEETVGGATHRLKLYISKDLKNWTNETIIPWSVTENWNKALMHYPMINDKTFCAGTEVDPENFTIVGTTFVNGINGGWPTPQYLRLSIKITED